MKLDVGLRRPTKRRDSMRTGVWVNIGHFHFHTHLTVRRAFAFVSAGWAWRQVGEVNCFTIGRVREETQLPLGLRVNVGVSVRRDTESLWEQRAAAAGEQQGVRRLLRTRLLRSG